MKFLFIFEFKPELKTYALLPTILLFLKGSESDDYSDLTIMWLCFGISLRFLK